MCVVDLVGANLGCGFGPTSLMYTETMLLHKGFPGLDGEGELVVRVKR